MGNKIAGYKPQLFYTLPVGTELTGELLSQFIKTHAQEILRFDWLASYLDGMPPIMVRKSPNQLLAVNDFAGYIVQLNSAYLVGNPVKYQSEYNIQPVLDSYKSQTISDLDSELAEDCSIYGKAYEVVYANEESQVVSSKLNVRNAFIIKDDTFAHKTMYAVSIIPVLDTNGDIIEGQFKVTVWDSYKIKSYNLQGQILTIENEQPHYFGKVPVIEYVNNRRMRGDYESVISLIDAYNILQSDRIIDREKLVDAILAFYGVNMTEEDRERIKQGRTITLPADAKGEYIIKNINEADADVLRQTIAADIHKFAKTPDMTDENFSGNASGVAISYKLLPFEENCKTKERYFEHGLMQRFSLYNSFLNIQSKMEKIDISDVDAIFTRSLPRNDYELSQMINNLDGKVDTPLLISQLSFVKDGEESYAKAKAEDEIITDNYGTENA